MRATARGRELSIERQSLKAETKPVTLTAPSGATSVATLVSTSPGLSTASVKAEEFGLYKLSDGELSALVNVGPENPREYQEVVSTMEHLRPLAEATGGTVRRVGNGKDDNIVLPRFAAMRESPLYGGSDYVGIKRTGASVVIGVGVAPLAIGFIGLIALLAGIVGPWLWEGRRARG